MNIDHDALDRLIQIAQSSGIHALQIEQGNSLIKIICRPDGLPTQATPTTKISTASTTPADDTRADADKHPPQQTPTQTQHTLNVTAPMLGTFYRKPSPDETAFVQVGDSVKAGDTLCIVEAMKMMYEVKAEQDGVIAKIIASEGEMVEFGATLMLIET